MQQEEIDVIGVQLAKACFEAGPGFFTLNAPPVTSPCARRRRKPRAAGTSCTTRRPACMANRSAFVRRGGSMPNFVVIVISARRDFAKIPRIPSDSP